MMRHLPHQPTRSHLITITTTTTLTTIHLFISRLTKIPHTMSLRLPTTTPLA